MIEDGDKRHYVAIKSLGRLLTKVNSKHNQSQHFCTNCLQGFSELKSRDEHYVREVYISGLEILAKL